MSKCLSWDRSKMSKKNWLLIQEEYEKFTLFKAEREKDFKKTEYFH